MSMKMVNNHWDLINNGGMTLLCALKYDKSKRAVSQGLAYRFRLRASGASKGAQ